MPSVVPYPWKRRPNFFSSDVNHRCRIIESGCLTRSLYVPILFSVSSQMVQLAPAKLLRNRDAVLVGSCCSLRDGVGLTGLDCFGMGMSWEDGVARGMSIFGGAEYHCVGL